MGWLWSERAMILTFGVNERSLRFVPLLASVIGLMVFPLLARWTTSNSGGAPGDCVVRGIPVSDLFRH